MAVMNILPNCERSRLLRTNKSAKRFLPIGKNTYYCVSSLIPPAAVLYLSVFFFSVHFSFCVAIKKKSEHNKNILARYSDNIFYVQNM